VESERKAGRIVLTLVRKSAEQLGNLDEEVAGR